MNYFVMFHIFCLQIHIDWMLISISQSYPTAYNILFSKRSHNYIDSKWHMDKVNMTYSFL